MATLIDWGMAGLLGLAIGSFLNVVIARLPRMIEREFESGADATAFNLSTPASHCPACLTPLTWRDKWPVLSFVWLRGRCRHCGAAISWLYPAVEVLTALWFVAMVGLYGMGVTAWCWSAWGAGLIALACIDARTHYLPDAITQPLCWAGLLAASLGWIGVDLNSAVWGAVAGYLMLWSVAWVFRRLRGVEGMGAGDFKLLAALGAWLGWQSLSVLVLVASVLGIAQGLLRPRALREAQPYFPFGPSLCLAGVLVLIWGRGQPVGLP
jgi:leader peptidase (prepilin peptidase)/N-methyltransferase